MMKKSSKAPSNNLSPYEREIRERFDKYKKDLNDTQDTLRIEIRTKKIPEPKELLPKRKSKADKVKRPANSFLLYTNQLRKCGLSKLVEDKICKEANIVDKKRKMPMERQLAGMLWKSLDGNDEIVKFFNGLAEKVAIEHKRQNPEYKLVPQRSKQKNDLKFKYVYENESELHNDCQVHEMHENINYTFQHEVYVEPSLTPIEHVSDQLPIDCMFVDPLGISQNMYEPYECNIYDGGYGYGGYYEINSFP